MAAKRKRELEGVLEGYREMAETAPSTLLAIALDTTVLLGTVDSAHTTLGTMAQTLRNFVERATGAIVDVPADSQFGGATSLLDLDDALSELARLLALHYGVKVAYSLCANTPMPLTVKDSDGRRGPSPMASWHGHRRDALRNAQDARRKLRSAAMIARAIEDAVRLFLTLPIGSPDWTTWTSAALKFARHAAVSAAMAQRALRRMRDAVALEFYDAWRVLHAVRGRGAASRTRLI